MPAKPLTREDLVETLRQTQAFIDKGYEPVPLGAQHKGLYVVVGEHMGISDKSVKNRLDLAEARYGLTLENFRDVRTMTVDAEGDRPDPLEVLRRHAAANSAFIQQKRTKPVVIPVRPEPFAVAFVGDPHITNAGCNLDALRRDIELLASSGVRAVQMGDVMDNFHKVPKLAEKEAQNRMSVPEALSLARWIMAECGVRWDAHVIGNHDAWLGAEGVALLAEWAREARTRLYDWNARLIYDWGFGRHVVAASHDFKGHSQYNPTHGPGKMALWDGTADTYVAAHKHHHADAKVPNGWRGRTYQLVRVRGYKDHDSYSAGRAQFPAHDGMEGRSALLVVNPQAETHDGRQRVFMDIMDGLEWLTVLKRRYAA